HLSRPGYNLRPGDGVCMANCTICLRQATSTNRFKYRFSNNFTLRFKTKFYTGACFSMKLYQLINITIKMGTAGAVANGIQEYYASTDAKAKLLGVWFSDIGQLNQVVVLSSFDSQQDLDAEKTRLAAQENVFTNAENIIKYSVENFEGFDFLPEVELGEFGPVYEIRTYELKHGGVPHV